MKKTLSILLIMALLFVLTSCKSKETKKVEQMISAIGTVTLEDESAIIEAVNLYNKLTKKEKSAVKNYEQLSQAQISYLNLLLESLEDMSLEDKDILMKAQDYYNSLTPEQQEKSDFLARIQGLNDYYAKLEAFEELKDAFKTKGTAKVDDDVNGSQEILSWKYGDFTLTKGGSFSYSVNSYIQGASTLELGWGDYYYPETRITISIYPDHFDIQFYSRFDEFGGSNDIDLAEGYIYDIKYENYLIDGNLPEITDYSSSTTAMKMYDTPFDSDAEYGQYIRKCIHEEIRSILMTFKNDLRYEISKLGFTEDVISRLR